MSKKLQMDSCEAPNMSSSASMHTALLPKAGPAAYAQSGGFRNYEEETRSSSFTGAERSRPC